MCKKITVDSLKNDNKLIYRYLRGSWAHGIAVEGKSDYDYSGVWLADKNTLLGLRSNYIEQVSDTKSDEVYYEFGRWLELLLKSNPTALESLFIDKEFIIGDVHPAVQYIINHRDEFLSKDAFGPLLGYSFEQIKRAQGYNKKCMYPEDMERKGVLDFCYTFKHQGSQPIKAWLDEHGLKQEYCGLVNVPNMKDAFAVFYDWGNHFLNEILADKDTFSVEKYEAYIEDLRQNDRPEMFLMPFEGRKPSYEHWCNNIWTAMHSDFIQTFSESNDFKYKEDSLVKDFFAIEVIKGITPNGYRGIVSKSDDLNESNEVRLSSIPDKDAKPICHMLFNHDAYQTECRKYKEWSEWKSKRNEIRYSDNKGYNFDAKNMCETIRLIHTGIELARGDGFKVKRTWDRDFLLDIKQHKYTYDEIMRYVTDKKAEFDELVKNSTLPEHIDYQKINQLLIDVRKKYIFDI